MSKYNRFDEQAKAVDWRDYEPHKAYYGIESPREALWNAAQMQMKLADASLKLAIEYLEKAERYEHPDSL